jgi:hypothetical protein
MYELGLPFRSLYCSSFRQYSVHVVTAAIQYNVKYYWLSDLPYPQDADSYFMMSSPIEKAMRFRATFCCVSNVVLFFAFEKLHCSFFEIPDFQNLIGPGSVETLMSLSKSEVSGQSM